MKNKRQIFFKGGDKTKILYECDCDDTPTPSFAKIKKPISNPSSNVRDKLRPENQIEFVLDKNEFATKNSVSTNTSCAKRKRTFSNGWQIKCVQI